MRNRTSIFLVVVAVLLAQVVVASAARTSYGDRVLRLGTRGSDVAALQQDLAQLGYNPGPIDGIFGNQTRQAVVAFQQDQNLLADGIAGPQTLGALRQALTSRSRRHTVKPGESLFYLARLYKTTVEAIMAANNLRTSTIYVGQVLAIPGGSTPEPQSQAVHHTVQRGDTLFALARRYGTSISDIMTTNGLTSSTIYVGQVLHIPVKGSNPPPLPAKAGVDVAAYYVEYAVGDDLSLQSFRKYHSSMTTVIAAGYKVTPEGRISGRTYQEMHQIARNNNMRVLAMVSNIGPSGSFERPLAHTILTNPRVRTRVIEDIYQLVRRQGYDGINIDFENVDPADRAAYTNFVRELAARLRPEGYVVTLSIPAKVNDDPNHGWSGAFDYRALGAIADEVMIMAYDQHYRSGHPGPVAGVDWVESVVRYALSEIPAKKIWLGIPTYGYDWPAGGTGGRSLTYAQAMELAAQYSIPVSWDKSSQTPHFRYCDSAGQLREVWFENASSSTGKLDLVNKYNLGGIAIWRLGFEDPALWGVIDSKFKVR